MKGPAFSVVLAGAVLVLASCATNTITGRNQLMLVSEEQAIGSSAAAYSSMMGGLSKKKQIEGDTERAKKVREITDRLIAQAVKFRPDSADWKWEVQVIDDPKTVNAFCMAGGKMAIYSGMWEKLKATDDEVAQVMGHEIGHALASHTRERMSVAYSTGIGTQVLAIAMGARPETAALMETASVVAIQLPNSRESESEADQIGIELAARAGYDPKAAVTLWEKMGRLGGTPPQFLSTHPSPENRAARLKELGAKVEPLYAAAKAHRTGAPSFLADADGKATKPGELTREEYARAAANQAETMTFLAEPFERFKSGKAVFDCRAQCALAFGNQKADWRKLHGEKRWRDLAISVMRVGYLSDLSYFMLAESAKNLGLKDPSAAYYKRALEAGKAFGCAGVLGNCEGFEVQRLSAKALAN
jgi:Zn-dependent protease with chaperone function